MPIFDAEAFANSTIEGEFSTEYEPVPEGEYAATIQSAEVRVTEKGAPFLQLQWQIDAPDVPAANGRRVRQTVWLDLNESGALDRSRGKNVALGRLLAALGLNGKPWSPAGLAGYTARVIVSHRTGDDGTIYDNVRSVRAL